jgi:hypothetical protein
MRREVGADCHGRCAGVVTWHVESLRACEWGYFVGACVVGVGGVADDTRGRELMISKTISDGSSWPRPALDNDEKNGIEWELRYAPLADITRSDLLVAAGIISAYGYLVMESTQAKRDLVCRDMREDEN